MQYDIKYFFQYNYNLSNYVAIIANGQFPQQGYLLELIRNAKVIICCDGAVANLLQYRLEPNFVVGDCDSISSTLRKQYSHCLIERTDQNTTDLTKAIDFGVNSLHMTNAIILGATGKREDHTLGNIASLPHYAMLLSNTAIISDYGMFTYHSGFATIGTVIGQQVSLFMAIKPSIVSTSGLKWELNNFELNSWRNGTLNQATATQVEIKCSQGLIAYRAFEAK